MIRTFVDTSFAIAVANKNDEFHSEALEYSFLLEDAALVTTDCVILEIGNSLASKFREQAVLTISNFLLSEEIEIVKLNADLFGRAFELYRTHTDKTWGMVDCVSFVVMRDLGVSKALTTDKHFSQAGFEVLLRAG